MDFVKNFKRWHIVALAIIVITLIACAALGGLRTGVVYAGGTLISINVKTEFDTTVIASALSENGVPGALVQTAGDRHNIADIRLQYSGDADGLASSVAQTIAKTYPGAKVVSAQSITAARPDQLFLSLFVPAVSVCAIALLYAWARYGIHAGISAGLMVIYTLALLFGVTGVVRLPVDPPFVSAWLLTAVCSVYSVHMLFERLKEIYQNDPQADKRRRELTNAGIRGSLPRMVSLAGALIVALAGLAIFGGASLREFALPAIIGLVVCVFTTTFLAAPLWIIRQEKAGLKPAVQKKKADKKK